MKLSPRIIATAAFAVFLMPAFNLHAEVATPLSASSSSAEPATPVPAESMAQASPYTRGRNIDTPRIEWFLGYSYLRATPTSADGNRMMWLNGGSTSVAFNFNRYLGIVGDFGGFRDSELRLGGTGGNASTVADSSGSVYTYLFGPRVSFLKHERFSPFAQALFGGVRASEVTLSDCTGAGCTLLPTENKFAMTAGGGLDIRVHRHFAIRVVQAEYLMTRFENFDSGKQATQNDMRLSSGVVFRFGGNAASRLPALPPVAYSCSVNPSSVFPGDAITVSGTALNLSPTKTAVYTWTTDGGTVSGMSDVAHIDTVNVAPGTYMLKGHVSEGDKAQENADCSAPYTVKAPEPLSVSCSADPSSVISGGSSTITAIAASPQNGPLTYNYAATSGSVNGTGSTATLSTIGVAAETVTVTCTVSDDKGHTASGTTSVAVGALAAAPRPSASALCSIHFDRDPRRPSRVDNEAKACLDGVALNLQSDSDAKLAIVGNASNDEAGSKKLAAERAVNTKAYLVKEKGIDASRISIYTGTQDGKIVSTTLIPAGATLDTTGDTPMDQ